MCPEQRTQSIPPQLCLPRTCQEPDGGFVLPAKFTPGHILGLSPKHTEKALGNCHQQVFPHMSHLAVAFD